MFPWAMFFLITINTYWLFALVSISNIETKTNI